MKFLAATLMLLSTAVQAELFISDTYKILIESGCEEGNVTCDTVRFTLDPSGIQQPQIIGTTVHSLCADGVTPCAFQGYEFISEDEIFFIHKSGVLDVKDSEGNQLLLEQGEWQY